jgi:hypothetical protein
LDIYGHFLMVLFQSARTGNVWPTAASANRELAVDWNVLELPKTG